MAVATTALIAALAKVAQEVINHAGDIGWALNQAFGPGKPSVRPRRDGKWYLKLYYDPRQKSRMTRTCTVGPYGDKAQRRAQQATRDVKFTLLNVKPEHAALVSFKLNADKGGPFQWRKDKARTAHCRPQRTVYYDQASEEWRLFAVNSATGPVARSVPTRVALRPGTDGDRGYYVCDIQGMDRKRFIDLNPDAAIMIEVSAPKGAPRIPRLGHP